MFLHTRGQYADFCTSSFTFYIGLNLRSFAKLEHTEYFTWNLNMNVNTKLQTCNSHWPQTFMCPSCWHEGSAVHPLEGSAESQDFEIDVYNFLLGRITFPQEFLPVLECLFVSHLNCWLYRLIWFQVVLFSFFKLQKKPCFFKVQKPLWRVWQP